MNYTIKIQSKDLDFFNQLNPYNHLDNLYNIEIFNYLTYPFFKYYFEKTPNVKIITNQTEKISLPKLENSVLCICLSSNRFLTFILNIFNKNCIYLNENEATRDIERTWKNLEGKIDFSKTKKICFYYNNWSKIVYAYRLAKMYNIEIEDITY